MITSQFKIGVSILLIASTIVLQQACKKTEITEQVSTAAHAYQFVTPWGFPDPILNPENPMTIEGIALGRQLYYDTSLSYGGPRQGMACASCHLQNKGFTLPNQPVLAHVNLAWNSNFLWKGEIAGTLEDIMLFEVDDFFKVDIKHLNLNSNYQTLFRKAFGDNEISSKRTAFAIAQFVRTLVSSNSIVDQHEKKQTVMSPSAIRGSEIFYSEVGDCFHCHGNALYTDNAFHNIGLKNKSSSDLGRYLVTGSSSDIGHFKTPTLRNIALKEVFMHDGRFKSLREVVMHYNSGVNHSDYLDPILDKAPLNLTENQINDLIVFLESLTDSDFLNHPDFSKP